MSPWQSKRPHESARSAELRSSRPTLGMPTAPPAVERSSRNAGSKRAGSKSGGLTSGQSCVVTAGSPSRRVIQDTRTVRMSAGTKRPVSARVHRVVCGCVATAGSVASRSSPAVGGVGVRALSNAPEGGTTGSDPWRCPIDRVSSVAKHSISRMGLGGSASVVTYAVDGGRTSGSVMVETIASEPGSTALHTSRSNRSRSSSGTAGSAGSVMIRLIQTSRGRTIDPNLWTTSSPCRRVADMCGPTSKRHTWDATWTRRTAWGMHCENVANVRFHARPPILIFPRGTTVIKFLGGVPWRLTRSAGASSSV